MEKEMILLWLFLLSSFPIFPAIGVGVYSQMSS